MQVAFSPAAGDVAPVLILLEVPEASEPVEHGHLQWPRVHAVVALHERVAQVVVAQVVVELMQRGQVQVVQIQIVRVTERQWRSAPWCDE